VRHKIPLSNFQVIIFHLLFYIFGFFSRLPIQYTMHILILQILFSIFSNNFTKSNVFADLISIFPKILHKTGRNRASFSENDQKTA